MGNRNRSNVTSTLSAKLPAELRGVVEAEATAHNVAMSDVVRACLEEVLINRAGDELIADLLVDIKRGKEIASGEPIRLEQLPADVRAQVEAVLGRGS